jgi:hypothetical protein
MKKEFVPYDRSLKLKEFGFDESCFGFYYDDGELKIKEGNISCLGYINAPTFSQAFRWFREKYEIDVFYWRNSLTDKYRIIEIKIRNKEISLEEKFENKEYKTYEEAELACLDKLIEIIKQFNNK